MRSMNFKQEFPLKLHELITVMKNNLPPFLRVVSFEPLNKTPSSYAPPLVLLRFVMLSSAKRSGCGDIIVCGWG